MNELNPGLPTVRLVNPPALVAADRMSARVEGRSAPLLRSLAGGAIRFSERFFQRWIGDSASAPLAAAAARSPVDSLLYPRPWFDEVRAWPARGIVLRPRAPIASERLATPGDARAIDLISSYVHADDSPTEATVERGLAPTPASIAARAFSPFVDRILRRANTLFTGAPQTPPRARAGIASDARVLLQTDGVAAPSVLDEPTAIGRATTAAAPPLLSSTTLDASARARSITLESGLPPVAPATWPRLQRFLDRLGGPIALARAGVVLPTETTARAIASFARAWVPSDFEPRGASVFVAPSKLDARLAPLPAASTASRGSTLIGELSLQPPLPSVGQASTERYMPIGQPPRSETAKLDQTMPSAHVAAEPVVAQVERVQRSERFAPGRLAQRAELLSQIAAQRSLRQLGYPMSQAPRSTRWSADAFTMVSPTIEVPTPSSIGRGTPIVFAGGSARALLPPTPANQAASFADRSFAPLGFVAPVAGATRGSVAAILEFADRQLGTRLQSASRPWPVLAPEVVYVHDDSGAPATATHAEPRPSPASSFASPALPFFGNVGPSDFGAASMFGTSSAAQPDGVGRAGLRSEQIAGELGVRAAGLASEFLIEDSVSQSGASASMRTDRAARLSTAEWTLLSVFPTAATAEEVVRAAARRTEMSGVRPSAAMPTRTRSIETRARAIEAVARAREVEGMSLPVLGVASPTADGTAYGPLVTAAPANDEARADALLMLPNGRRPRGNRIAVRAPSTVLTSALSSSPSPLLASSDSVERRVESPIGAPLWNHLRPPVHAEASAQVARSGASPRVSAALELVTPYVDMMRNEPASGSNAASFARETAVAATTSARTSEDAGRTLVRAQSAQSSADRLSLADLTLISIISANQQVAAASSGDVKPADTSGNSAGATSSIGVDEDAEVERIADKAFQRFRSEMGRHLDNNGDPWER